MYYNRESLGSILAYVLTEYPHDVIRWYIVDIVR